MGSASEVPVRWMTIADASAYTRLSVPTIHRLLDQGKLKRYRPTGLRRVLLDKLELDALIEGSSDNKTDGG